jgi:O-antigen/teichoic acid export membrane protein
MRERLLSFFSKGHKRSILAKKNIIFSLFIKFFSMVIVFVMVSKSIDYLGKEAYGLWVLLSSVLVWTALFDFGLTNGLRNKLSESLASLDSCSTTNKNMISATYATMFFIALGTYAFTILVIYLVDWKELFSVELFSNGEIRSILMIIFLAFSLNLFLKPIHAILKALQWPSVIMVFSLVASVISLVSLYILPELQIENRLFIYTLVISFLPVIVLLFGSIYLFNRKLKQFRPSFKNIDFKLAKDVSLLGYSFFVIQFAGLVISQTDNIIIAYLFGTKSVTDYSVVYRYFSIFLIGISIVLTPFWSAFTEAYVKKEFEWIEKSIRKLMFTFIAMAFLVTLFVYYSADVYKIWIGEDMNPPLSLSIVMGCYVVVYSFSNIFVYFVNGTGYIKVQMYVGVVMAILNIPLSYLFAELLGYGISGVIVATTICAAIPGIFSYMQYNRIINGNAKGIWIK